MHQLEDSPARPVGPNATIAGGHGEILDRAVVADPEMEGWRRNEMRFLAGRVEELESQLRRRTWLLGGGFGLSLLAATALAGAIWLPQPLNPWPIARQAATATTPPSKAEPVVVPPPAVAKPAPPAVMPPAANTPSPAAPVAPEAPPTALEHPRSATQDADPNPLPGLAGQPQPGTPPATTTAPAAGLPAVTVPSVSLPSVTVDPATPAAPSTSGTTPPDRASEPINRLTVPDPAQ